MVDTPTAAPRGGAVPSHAPGSPCPPPSYCLCDKLGRELFQRLFQTQIHGRQVASSQAGPQVGSGLEPERGPFLSVRGALAGMHPDTQSQPPGARGRDHGGIWAAVPDSIDGRRPLLKSAPACRAKTHPQFLYIASSCLVGLVTPLKLCTKSRNNRALVLKAEALATPAGASRSGTWVERAVCGAPLMPVCCAPVPGSLTALVCQHSITPLALPCKLLIPDRGTWGGGSSGGPACPCVCGERRCRVHEDVPTEVGPESSSVACPVGQSQRASCGPA